MAQSFSATVDEWVQASIARMLAVFQTATEYVIEDAQRPGPSVASANKERKRTKKSQKLIGPIRPVSGGGHLPIDTGYLRASATASLNAMPAIRKDAQPAEGRTYTYSGDQISLSIAGAELGQTIYFGWTAAYAGVAENRYGFMRLSAQRWPQFVNQAVSEAKARAGA